VTAPALDWRRFRSAFPATDDLVYLDHAGGGPLSSRVQERLARYAHDAAHLGAFEGPAVWETERERTRERAAQLLSADAPEIAFPTGAREGLRQLLLALDWRRGDAFLLRDADPDALPASEVLRRKGVRLRRVAPAGQPPSPRALADALASPAARLLLTRSVEPGSGARVDLAALGRQCRERGALLAVDASSSLGALALAPRALGVDLLVCDGHRWLGSVRGCGITYCGRELRDRVPLRDEVDADSPGIAALGGALDLLLEAGPRAVEERVVGLAGRLARRLREQGFVVRTPEDPAAVSGVVLFAPKGSESAEALRERLHRERIHVGVSGDLVRAAPHFYTDEDELETLVTRSEPRRAG
jgi:cysteine desulfurase/selenocysteine lyase